MSSLKIESEPIASGMRCGSSGTLERAGNDTLLKTESGRHGEEASEGRHEDVQRTVGRADGQATRDCYGFSNRSVKSRNHFQSGSPNPCPPVRIWYPVRPTTRGWLSAGI